MNYLYKLATTENVEINYDTFKKKELIECLATMRDIYFSLKQENQQLKDNWNKLKEYIEKDYGFYDKLIAPKYGCAMGALRRIKDKMQELEQGSDSNE